MYGNASKPSRIYSYKADGPAPGPGGREVFDQLHLAHRYRNTLIRLERDRRAAVDAVVADHFPRVWELDAGLAATGEQIVAIHVAINSRSRIARSRQLATQEERARLDDLKARRREIEVERKALRDFAFSLPGPVVRARIQAINDADDVARKVAYAASGIFWGTRLMINQAFQDIRKGSPPEFRRWTEDGALAVQLQKGLGWDQALLGGDRRIRIRLEPPGPEADRESSRSRNKRRAILSFRIGSEGPAGRVPRWVEVPFWLDRMPPRGSRIKWVYLRRSLVGRRVTWEVQFVLERDSWDRDVTPEGGSVGIDVNWRLMPAGLRVAYAVGEDGAEDVLFLPRSWLSCWEKAASLQAIRDRNFDEIRPRIADWLADHDVPDWLSEMTERLRSWRSSDRLGAVAWLWKDRRFPGDEAIFPDVAAWRRQDKHLHDWQDGQLRKVVRRRDDLYRKWAKKICGRYRTVRIEDIDWSEIKALPEPGEPDPASFARVYNRIASPGRLSQILREFAVEVVRVPAADTTRRCHSCGNVDEFDAARELSHTCSACGVTWDQDRNAGLNLLEGGDGVGDGRAA
jgi:hypothetical protein